MGSEMRTFGAIIAQTFAAVVVSVVMVLVGVGIAASVTDGDGWVYRVMALIPVVGLALAGMLFILRVARWRAFGVGAVVFGIAAVVLTLWPAPRIPSDLCKREPQLCNAVIVRS